MIARAAARLSPARASSAHSTRPAATHAALASSRLDRALRSPSAPTRLQRGQHAEPHAPPEQHDRGASHPLVSLRSRRSSSGAIGADRRQRVEVVSRRRRARCPLECLPCPTDRRRPARRRRSETSMLSTNTSTDNAITHDPDGLEHVQSLPASRGGIARDPARHALRAEDEHREEREVRADRHQHEVQLAQPLAQHRAGDLRKPVVDARRTARKRCPRRSCSESARPRSRTCSARSPAAGRRGSPRSSPPTRNCTMKPEREQEGGGETQAAAPDRRQEVQILDARRHDQAPSR